MDSRAGSRPSTPPGSAWLSLSWGDKGAGPTLGWAGSSPPDLGLRGSLAAACPGGRWRRFSDSTPLPLTLLDTALIVAPWHFKTTDECQSVLLSNRVELGEGGIPVQHLRVPPVPPKSTLTSLGTSEIPAENV